jgi:hyaluronan synthase
MEILWSEPVSRATLVAGMLYGGLSMVWCFWRLWLAIRYRPYPVVEEHRLPSITVIVPAFNEGPLVGETLRCLAGADYPRGRLKIIVVDDGSTDDTWSHIEAAANDIGTIVTPIHCPTNRGKRWALWEGFRRGKGEVFVTVDSDSLIEPTALRELVSPMVHNKSIGAVAGNVRVLNRQRGLIPRMIAVRYVMTFDYKRAAQSMMGGGAVLCCAGALAAYRSSAVAQVLDRWLHQTFRGGPARAGEDHAMTNFILSRGYKVCYQRTARVRTSTPSTYANLCKMFLRWGRSNVRETVHTGRYVFTRFRKERKLGIRFNFLMGAMGLILPYPFLVAAILLALFLPAIFGLKLLAACVYGSLFTILFCLVRERSSEAVFGLPYAFYSTFLLWWIWPYALLTCHKSVWLTRTACVASSAQQPDGQQRLRNAASLRLTRN